MIDIRNKNYSPSLDEIVEYIRNPVFLEFCEDVKIKFNAKEQLDFSSCSWEYGWNVKFKKSGKKTSDFCKENLRMPDVKSYDYVFNYFSDSKILVSAIKEYHRIARIPKGEYTLLDLLK